MLHEIGSRQKSIGANEIRLRGAYRRAAFDRVCATGFRAAGDLPRAGRAGGAGRREGALGLRTLPLLVAAGIWLGSWLRLGPSLWLGPRLATPPLGSWPRLGLATPLLVISKSLHLSREPLAALFFPTLALRPNGAKWIW
jgi:hypothetical protein